MSGSERRTDGYRAPIVRRAAARAWVSTAEYDHIDVPQWIRDVAEGRESTAPDEQAADRD